jgi:transcriptional regulator with XRE-family HTH domain
MKILSLDSNPSLTLREARAKAKLTQKELVAEVKKSAAAASLPAPSITETRISEYETGRCVPRSMTAHLLTITFNRLLKAA